MGNRSLLSYLLLTLKGFCMGAADVVPGVSGGTMAFILGIYEELIKAIRSFDLHLIKSLISLRIREASDHASWPFLGALGLGILTAIFSLAGVLGWVLQNRPVLIWSFFFGLILASIITVSRNLERWKAPAILWALLGAIGAYFLVGLVPMSTPNAPWFLILSGAVAICAMILPGISGAFILVLLGKYQYVLDAVNKRDFFTLFLVAAGAGVGLIAFSRILNLLFKKQHDMTVALLVGFMFGSLRKVWPWKKTLQTIVDSHGKVVPIFQTNILPLHLDQEVTLALSLMGAGLLVVFLLNFWAQKKKD